MSGWCVECDWNVLVFFFVKQKTAYEMRSSDWSSDVCASDLSARDGYRAPMATPQSGKKSPSRRVSELPDGPPDATGLTPRQQRVLAHIKDSIEKRSEERRVGKECVSPGSSLWSPHH